MLSRPKLSIWTDGSCLGNPGPGAWAYFTQENGTGVGGKEKTTNNEMELWAIYEATSKYCPNFEVKIFSDSLWSINGIKKIWNVKVYLWMFQAIRKWSDLEIEWVRGHDSSEQNIIADALAVAEAKRIKRVWQFR